MPRRTSFRRVCWAPPWQGRSSGWRARPACWKSPGSRAGRCPSPRSGGRITPWHQLASIQAQIHRDQGSWHACACVRRCAGSSWCRRSMDKGLRMQGGYPVADDMLENWRLECSRTSEPMRSLRRSTRMRQTTCQYPAARAVARFGAHIMDGLTRDVARRREIIPAARVRRPAPRTRNWASRPIRLAMRPNPSRSAFTWVQRRNCAPVLAGRGPLCYKARGLESRPACASLNPVARNVPTAAATQRGRTTSRPRGDAQKVQGGSC